VDAVVDGVTAVVVESGADERAVADAAEVFELACAAPFPAEHPAAARPAVSTQASATPVRSGRPPRRWLTEPTLARAPDGRLTGVRYGR
jgi:hypothetical protein